MYSGNEGTSVPFNVVLLFVQQVPCSHKIENGEVCINSFSPFAFQMALYINGHAN